MAKVFLGIDISKAHFDVALLNEGKMKTKKFSNNAEGYHLLFGWLSAVSIEELHACMEATGPYGDGLATYLYEQNIAVSVVNPAQIKGFSLGELGRTKTDKADAKLIARFCEAIKPSLWQPKPLPVRKLQAWVRRLEGLQKMQQQEQNRLDVSDPDVQISIHDTIQFLTQEMVKTKKIIKQIIAGVPELAHKKQLLLSIPGIGETTAVQILAFIGDVESFQNARQYAAYVGLNPKQCQSGTSVHKKARLSKAGNSSLRKAFYMPAITAKKYNPLVQALSQRLEQANKPKMVIVGAAMRKLVHIVYGVLKTNSEFSCLAI